MRIPEFLFLSLITGLATYWMNESILAGSYLWASLYGAVVVRNLYFSYRVSRFIRVVEKLTKKKD